MNAENKKIVIMAGGTGGHIYPALSVADFLKEKGWDIVWMGTQKGLEKKIVPDAGYPIEWLDIRGVRGKKLSQMLLAPINIMRSCFQAYCILKKNRPDVVLGMGGFVSVPGGLMSMLLRKPLLIHEQNAVPGSANKLLQFFAKKVLFAFENTFKINKKYLNVGNPVRQEIVDVENYKQKESDGINLLVLGGSLGANKLNEVVPAAIKRQEKKINVVHQCGEKHFQSTSLAYENASVEAKVLPYIKDMHEVYAWADLAICRAGAMTVAELAVAGVPAIFVPYPYAIDDHQTINAMSLVKINGARIIHEKNLDEHALSNEIANIANDLNILVEMKKNIKKAAKPDAVQHIAELCVEVSAA